MFGDGLFGQLGPTCTEATGQPQYVYTEEDSLLDEDEQHLTSNMHTTSVYSGGQSGT